MSSRKDFNSTIGQTNIRHNGNHAASNYLDGNTPSPEYCKDCSAYGQWQGICLETQCFPSSVGAAGEVNEKFRRGKCFILEPGGEDYGHTVSFEFGSL